MMNKYISQKCAYLDEDNRKRIEMLYLSYGPKKADTAIILNLVLSPIFANIYLRNWIMVILLIPFIFVANGAGVWIAWLISFFTLSTQTNNYNKKLAYKTYNQYVAMNKDVPLDPETGSKDD